jgi:hypothetical protein
MGKRPIVGVPADEQGEGEEPRMLQDLKDSILYEVHSALTLAHSLVHRSTNGRGLEDPHYVRLLVVAAQTKTAAEAVSEIIDQIGKNSVRT